MKLSCTLAPILLVALATLAGRPAAAQVCTGQAYFKPLEHRGIEFAQYTSRAALVGNPYQQTNCVVLVNDSALTVGSIEGSFSFASTGLGAFEIASVSTQPLTGSVSTQCTTQPQTTNGPQVIGEIVPTGGALAPGQHTDACCFVHEAQYPPTLCTSLPGPGDVFTVSLMAGGGGPIGLTSVIPSLPQQPACGLVGLELLLGVAPLALLCRRRHPQTTRRSKRAALLLPLSAMLSVVGGQTADADDYAAGPGTDVGLTLTAFTHQTEPAAFSGTLGAQVLLQAGHPTVIGFGGGDSLLIADLTITATSGGGPSISTTLDDVEVSLSSAMLAVDAGGDFDASAVTVTFDAGLLTGAGTVFNEGFSPSRDFAAFPAPLPNLATAPGNVTSTPLFGGGFDIVISLPIELCSPLSTQTGAPWLLVEDGVVELTATVTGAPIPALGAPALLALAFALALCGWLAQRSTPDRATTQRAS